MLPVMTDVRTLVEARLTEIFGEPDARAAVTFLGTDRIEVLRFRAGEETGPADPGSRTPSADRPLLRYATLGMSLRPMTDPAAVLADPVRGPRAELLLTVRAGRADTSGVLRPLAVLAASPQVEGVVIAPGAALDLGEPLWPGAPFTSVLVGEPGGLVPDLDTGPVLGTDPVRFLPLLPMTPNEAAWKRVHGAPALQERWLARGTDLRDPLRASVALD
jgi:hypothetical protein